MPFTIRNDPSYATVGRMAQQAGYAEALPKAIALKQQQQQLDLSRQKAAADHRYRMAAQFAKAKEARYRSAEQARQRQIQEKAAENKEYLDAVSHIKAELDPSKYRGEDAVDAARLLKNFSGVGSDKLLNSGSGSHVRSMKAYDRLFGEVKRWGGLERQVQPTATDILTQRSVMSLGEVNALRRVDADRAGEEYVPLYRDLDQENTSMTVTMRNGQARIEVDTDDRKAQAATKEQKLKAALQVEFEKEKARLGSVTTDEARWDYRMTPKDQKDTLIELADKIREDAKEESKEAKEAVEGLDDEQIAAGSGLSEEELIARIAKEEKQLAGIAGVEDDASDEIRDASEGNIESYRAYLELLRAKDRQEGSYDEALRRLQEAHDSLRERDTSRKKEEVLRERSEAGLRRAASLRGPSEDAKQLIEAVSTYSNDEFVGGENFQLLEDLKPSDEDYYKVKIKILNEDGKEETFVGDPAVVVPMMDRFYEKQKALRQARRAENSQIIDETVQPVQPAQPAQSASIGGVAAAQVPEESEWADRWWTPATLPKGD